MSFFHGRGQNLENKLWAAKIYMLIRFTGNFPEIQSKFLIGFINIYLGEEKLLGYKQVRGF